jgi:hypothetical protein
MVAELQKHDKLKCPLQRVDGTKPVEELLNQIMIGEADNG